MKKRRHDVTRFTHKNTIPIVYEWTCKLVYNSEPLQPRLFPHPRALLETPRVTDTSDRTPTSEAIP